MSACPPAEALLGFISGQLGDERAATIESHIDSCSECRGALSNFARGDTPPSFGRYRIDTVLGSGGMGIVYRGWDPQLGRAVAIKVLRHSGDDTVGRARLVREAQSLARLSHPNVCHVYDVGTEGDEVWVAMELVDGVTLRQWAGDSRPEHELLDVLLGAADGIAAAHDAGLVHRDVKPENVLVTRDGRAIVTDFGLARADDAIDPRGATFHADPNLTTTGAIAGTPAYLAPEQLGGDPIDARVDQFAWAVMAWELLTGIRPFPVIFAVRLDAIRAGVTPPPSLAPHLAAVLARAMSAAPRDRFPSMRELVTAVRAKPAAPVAARPRRTRVAVLAAVGALAAGGIAIAWQGHDRADPVPVPVPLPLPVPAPVAAAVPAPAPAPAPAPVPAPAVAPAPAPAPPPIVIHKPTPKPAPPPEQITLKPPMPAPSPSPPPAPPGYDTRYSRSRALAVMAQQCRIPYDFAHPGSKNDHEIADWGKVTKVADEHGNLGGDRPETLRMIYVQGQRRMYKIDDDLDALGVLSVKPGDLLALCPEDQSEIHQLASGPIDTILTAVTLSAPPRSPQLASLAPTHVNEMAIVAAASSQGRGLDPKQRYLYQGQVKAADGGLWQMDRYWLEVPSGIRGAGLVAEKKRLWFVVDHPRFDGKRFVVTAAAVVDDLFP
jgi:serine/threonine protein kinase